MPYLQENEWLLLNDIIFKVHSIENSHTMRLDVLNALELIIPFSFASFYMASDNDERYLTDPVAVNIPEEKLDEWYAFQECDYMRWVYQLGKSMVCNETDLLTDCEREKTKYYQEFYAQRDIHYSIQLSIAYNSSFLGIISLYRKKSEINFSKRDLFVLEQLKDHLAYRLDRDKSIRQGTKHKSASADNELTKAEELLASKGFTKRETEIHRLLIQGFSNKELSDKLFISPHTVKKHLKNIYKKLGVKNRLQIIIDDKTTKNNPHQ
jgi:DNA-binding CsgD family transcriptional regulator